MGARARWKTSHFRALRCRLGTRVAGFGVTRSRDVDQNRVVPRAKKTTNATADANDQSSWMSVEGAALRALRIRRGLSQEKLASTSGVGERTVRLLEGGGGARTLRETVRCLATALEAPLESFASVVTPPVRAASTNVERVPDAPSPAPPVRVRLADLVARERAFLRDHGPSSRIDGVEALTAQRFQDVVTAFLEHDGVLFDVVGVLDEQRGVGVREAMALGGECGRSARFRVRVVLATGEMLSVTVHARGGETTRAMQRRMYEAASMRVRVVGKAIADDESAKLFAWFDSASAHPWTFVIEEVREEAGGG